eukprot:sb/3469769/
MRLSITQKKLVRDTSCYPHNPPPSPLSVQYNRLSVSGWTVAKDPVTLTCRYRYDTTGETASYNTQLLFKGTISSRIIVGDRSCPHETLNNVLSAGFTSRLQEYVYYEPSSKSIYCTFGFTYSTTGPSGVSWFKDGQSLSTSSNRYEVAVREETGNWEASLSLNGTFSDTIATDSGSYTCQFQFSSGESYNQTTQLQFYSKFNAVEVVTILIVSSELDTCKY